VPIREWDSAIHRRANRAAVEGGSITHVPVRPEAEPAAISDLQAPVESWDRGRGFVFLATVMEQVPDSRWM
jgi:hypothetical protein